MDNSTTPDLPVEVQQLIQELNEAYTLLYSEFACLAVAVYHIIISFDEEVQLIWKRPINFPVILYVFTRYIQPIFYMLGILSSLWPKTGEDQGVCDAITNTANILQIFFTIGVRGLLCLRAYALSEKKWLAIALLGSTFLGDITCYIVGISMFPGCLDLDSSGEENMLITAELACGIANDTAVLAITMYELWGRLKSKPSIKNDFGSMLIKQGLLRYLFVIAIATQELVSIFTDSINSNISGTFVTLFSSIIVSDFLLALRRHNTRPSIHSEAISAGLIWSVALPATVPPRNNNNLSISSLFHSANAQIMADFTIHENENSLAEAEPLNSNPNDSNNNIIYDWNFRNSRSFPDYIGELAGAYQFEEWASNERPQERDL